VREIGERRKLFEEPAGVADGVTAKVNVPVGVISGAGCCTELALPPPQPFTSNTRHTSAATPLQLNANAESFPRSRLLK
jgi:hypothetical protein